MYALYSAFLFIFRIVIGALALFDSKIKRGIDGRKDLFAKIDRYYPSLNPLRKRILIHVSSFGELEQAKPVIAKLKEEHPTIHIHLTFFSPSGYDNAADSYELPDIITYLPFDLRSDVNWFLDITKPDLVLFVRYDLWHNFVRAIHDRNIPMMLFSATFDLSRGKMLPLISELYKNTYSFINTIYTISESDKLAIEKFALHAREITVAGDTRADQVINRKQHVEEANETLLPVSVSGKIESGNLRVLVAGSTWASDEDIIVSTLDQAIKAGEKLFVIIAPHEVDTSRVDALLSKFGKESIPLSRIGNYEGQQVIIVDSIGKLFSLYSLASIAFVGGGFGAGVHNVLEPAVWGIPSIVGPNHKRSQEIGALIGLGGAVEVQNGQEFEEAFSHWFTTDMAREVASMTAKNYVFASQGATQKIIIRIREMLSSEKNYEPS